MVGLMSMWTTVPKHGSMQKTKMQARDEDSSALAPQTASKAITGNNFLFAFAEKCVSRDLG